MSKKAKETQEVNETEAKTRKRSEVTWSMRFYTFKLKERKVISRKGNEVMFVEFTQGRKVGDRIFGGRIAIPMFRLGQFLCELVEAIDTIVRRYNPVSYTHLTLPTKA